MPLTLQIKLLGEWSITYGDRAITGINTARSQALLAYLILYRHSPQPRQRLAFHLWADSTETQARTNLRKELSYLRRDLPEADRFLLVESKTLQWSPTAPFIADIVAFENVLKAAEAAETEMRLSLLKQAIALYQGELLPGCGDDWIIPERERFQQMYGSALEQLIGQLEVQQDYRVALSYAQQLLRVDSLNEATYCTLMRLHSRIGDRANALQVYYRCMTMLREELGVDPSSTTRGLYEHLLQEEAEPVTDKALVQPTVPLRGSLPLQQTKAGRRSPSLPFVGRDREWRFIQTWVSPGNSEVTPPLLLLIGELGIGKTRLLEKLRETVPLALWGRGFAAETVRPYGIWIDALRSMPLPAAIPPELGFLLPEVGQPAVAPPNRSHLFDAIVQLLGTWASQNPLMVMLDDIQWMDEASSALLHYTSRLLSHLPIKFACTARSGELSQNGAIAQVVQALRREQRLKTIELQGFDRGETADLIRTLSNSQTLNLSVEIVDQVFTDSGGNPLFVLEIARALSQSQSNHTDNLEALIRDRFQKFDDAAHDLLLWAAALGRNFNPTILAKVMDLPLPRLLAAIDQLEQHGIIRPGHTLNGEVTYDFAHDIVRQVAYQQLSEPRRRLIHTHIAQVLSAIASPTTPLINDVAHHADLGSDRKLAASASLLAAERCLRVLAYAEAAELAQRGIRHCEFLETTTQIRLQMGLLKAYVKAGVPKPRVASLQQDLHHLIQEAAKLKLKDEEAAGLEALIVLNYDHGNLREVQQHSLQAAEQGRTASPATTMYMLAHTGYCLAEIGRDIPKAEALLLEAQSIAERLGLESIDISLGLGCVRRYQGQEAEVRLLLRQGLQMAQLAQDHWRECTCLTNLIMLNLETEQPALAVDYCRELIRVSTQMGEGSEALHGAALDAVTRYLLQEQDAEAALEQSCQMLKAIDSPRILAFIQTVAARWDIQQGKVKQAIVRAEEAWEAAQEVDNPSEIALAGAVLIQANQQLGQVDFAEQHLLKLKTLLKGYDLSNLAQQTVSQLKQPY
ncbi:AAA family ATPase [Phormidium tenue FACHB-886]|nr:AAA family ATPase [Phormidium tenue FACHB-886]